jgi:predicted phosphodiesterase
MGAEITERIAIISDVHGNLTALEAVLSHIRSSGISRIFNLGDLVGKGPRSAETVDRCRDVCDVIVQGNWDADIAASFFEPYPEIEWHTQQLGAERCAYLGALPGSLDFQLSGRRVRLFHASQKGVHHRVRQASRSDEHDAMFQNTAFTGAAPEPSLVGYGDIHIAYLLNVNGRTLFNAGSVGNALDFPTACYVILEGVYGSDAIAPWEVRFIRVPYDIEAEIAVALRMDMPKAMPYATELRTAVYRGRQQLARK